jgi:beta-xylosidase
MIENGGSDKSGGMGESTPYRLFRAMQEIGGLTKEQIDDLVSCHQPLLRRLGESYLSRSSALPSTSGAEAIDTNNHGEQSQPV